MAFCRSCSAPVIWVETEATAEKPGRLMPLDADPDQPTRALRVEGGNIVFVGGQNPRGAPIVRYAKNGMHRSHFATCPNSKSHRRT